VVPSHEIFNKPLKVDLAYEEVPTPENYSQLAGDRKLGKTIQVWRVQTKKFPEIDPGLVSNPHGFGDSPDAEVISSGLNSKGPESVALARHGNFFLWGFSASPTDMTPEGRKCFVNAVCYLRKFDGRKPLVREVGAGFTRGGALWYAYYLRNVLDEEVFRREVPEPLRNDPQQYARYRQAVLGGFERSYPEELRRRLGNDPEKYIGWVQENLEYLRFEGEGYDARPAVDEDVKSLGVSNRKVELLARCVAMLEQGDRPELASRVLTRYTTEHFSEPKGWRSWLEASRGRLFFTDVGGFKWVVAPEALIKDSGSARVAASLGGDATPQEPDREHPVVAEARLTPATLHPGDDLTLVVRVRTAPTWHVYAVGGSGGPGVPTTLKLTLPKGVEAQGEWEVPKPTRGPDGQAVYEGTFEFRRTLRVSPAVATGPVAVALEVGYQACDPHSCRPPARAELKAKAEVVKDRPER
jgi:hypothetical protein